MQWGYHQQPNSSLTPPVVIRRLPPVVITRLTKSKSTRAYVLNNLSVGFISRPRLDASASECQTMISLPEPRALGPSRLPTVPRTAASAPVCVEPQRRPGSQGFGVSGLRPGLRESESWRGLAHPSMTWRSSLQPASDPLMNRSGLGRPGRWQTFPLPSKRLRFATLNPEP